MVIPGQGGGDLGQPALDPFNHLGRIRPAQRHHQPFDRLALAVVRDRAIAGERADAYFCHIAHAQHTGRPSAAPRRKIIERADGAGGAHDQRFLARGQAARAIIAVARVDGAGQIGHAEPAAASACMSGATS
jgi:hypothetical protein